MFTRVREHDPFVIEIVGGAAALAWGLYGALDGRPLGLVASFDPLCRVPDSFWCAWAMVGGALQITAALRRWRVGRLAIAFMQMTLFEIIGVAVLVSPQPSPGAMLYLALAKGDVWTAIHLLHRPKAVDGAK